MIVLSSKTLTARILLYLSDNPGATIKNLSTTFNVSLKTIRNIIYRLKNNGFIEKTGNGYILTTKGEWFVNNILKKRIDVSKETIREKTPIVNVEESIHETSNKVETETSIKERESIEDSFERSSDINVLMNRLEQVEKELEYLRNMLNKLVRELNFLKKNIEDLSRITIKYEEKSILPRPVMNIREAISMLGSQLDRFRIEGRVLFIGSIVVDREFYENFVKKFPIDISEIGKLSELEKILLDEMIKDARVIIHSGKQYRLVS